MTSALTPGAVDLYWIPLGAGAHVVRLSGKVYEALTAFIGRRPRCALYHTALEVGGSDGRFVIESAPIRDNEGPARGVVAEGPVGTRWAGRFLRTSSRCQRSRVSGLTTNEDHWPLGIALLAAASRSRSRRRRRGRFTCRCSTLT